MPPWMPKTTIPGIHGQAIQMTRLFFIMESMDAELRGRDIHGDQRRLCHAPHA
jgi:hypothetical protein